MTACWVATGWVTALGGSGGFSTISEASTSREIMGRCYRAGQVDDLLRLWLSPRAWGLSHDGRGGRGYYGSAG